MSTGIYGGNLKSVPYTKLNRLWCHHLREILIFSEVDMRGAFIIALPARALNINDKYAAVYADGPKVEWWICLTCFSPAPPNSPRWSERRDTATDGSHARLTPAISVCRRRRLVTCDTNPSPHPLMSVRSREICMYAPTLDQPQTHTHTHTRVPDSAC